MKRTRPLPIALTIAGSDSGGGAGVQADLKTFAALGVHGTSVLTCVTGQNPKAVLGVQPCGKTIILRQLQALFRELSPDGVKTGMLYSARIIRTVAGFLQRHRPTLVVDPVMVSTSGACLLEPGAVRSLCRDLLPLARLVTPNVPEAELLTGLRIRSVEHLRKAARQLQAEFHCAALVKGGHLRGLRQAVDIFFDGQNELLLSAPFVRGVSTHGTGCTYSAAITALLARGAALPHAVHQAKEFITGAILHSHKAAGHDVLNNLWTLKNSQPQRTRWP